MLPIPADSLAKFEEVLKKRAVPEPFHMHYRKWLRYFLDFRVKCSPPEAKSEQVRLFIDKLRSKNQTPKQLYQASHAVSLFFESQQPGKTVHIPPAESVPATTIPARSAHQPGKAPETKEAIPTIGVGLPATRNTRPATATFSGAASTPPSRPSGGKRFNEWRCLEKTKSPAWDQAIDKLAAEIKTRHYSRKTLKTYE